LEDSTYNKYISSSTLLVILFIYLILLKKKKSKTWPLTSYINLPFLKRENPYKNESRFLKRGNNSILYLCLNCQNMQLDKTEKNNDRGANKSLIIHKTSQNNRNNII
jgi:hypothetical protein